MAHRLAWLLHYGKWPINEIDHIDGNPTNNVIDNLRTVSSQKNKWNSRPRRTNPSGMKYISILDKCQKKYLVQVQRGAGIRLYRESFYSLEKAMAARDVAVARYRFGYHLPDTIPIDKKTVPVYP